MIRFLLDTDHYTLLEHGHPPILGRLLTHPATEIAISVITIEEAVKGRIAALSRAKDRESQFRGYDRLAKSVKTIASLNFICFEDQADLIFQSLKSNKLRIGTKDLKIASVALANSCVVVTRNRRDFGQIPGLTIEDWSGN